MPEIRDASEFGNKLFIRGITTTVLGLAGFMIAVMRLPIVDAWTMAGGVLFLLVMVVFLYWSVRPGGFRCPQCGAQIPTPTQMIGPMQFHCVKCDVLWDTGIKQWSGGD